MDVTVYPTLLPGPMDFLRLSIGQPTWMSLSIRLSYPGPMDFLGLSIGGHPNQSVRSTKIDVRHSGAL